MKWATPQQIISNTLFDQGYQRFGVRVVFTEGERSATVWARNEGDVAEFYWGRGEGVLAVHINQLPLARFSAQVVKEEQVMGKWGWETQKTYSGDVILSDELLTGWYEQEAS